VFRVEVKGLSLSQLAERVAESPQGVAEALAEETLALIFDGFEDSTAPDGEPWADLAIRDGNPLLDTNGLRGAWARGDVTPEVVEAVNGKDYADYHQDGTGIHGPHKMTIKPVKAKALAIPGVGFRSSSKGAPARPMVPDGDLPKPWADRYDAAVEEYLDGELNL
jgi:hypothetical protein